MRILQIVLLLRVCWCLQPISLNITDILEIAKLSKDVTIDLFKTFKLLDEDVGVSPKVKGQRVLFKEFKVFNNKIDMFNAQLEGIGSIVLYAMVGYTDRTDIQRQLKQKIMEANDNIDFVNLKYKDMGTFIESKVPYDDLTLEEFARSIVSPSNSSLQSALDRIHAIIAPSQDYVQNIFKILVKITRVQVNGMFCNMQTSAQQLVLHLYYTLALTELKGFLMMEFSYMLLKLQNKGNFTKEIKAAQERYTERSAITLKLTIEAIQAAPLEFWKCDPHTQMKNETYIEITEFLQGYIENEIDLNLGQPCYYTCAEKKESNNLDKCYDRRAKKDTFCKKNRECKGKIVNCHFIPDGTVCLPYRRNKHRRIDYISLPEKWLGHRKKCRNGITVSYARWKWSYFFWWCDYCMCLCDEQGDNSDRYFSLRSSESDIHHNMVVTGLRFVKKNRIIHLQIQEGKLLPRAKINVATVQWKPVEDYTIDEAVDGLDYHTLTWEKRGFDLDDIVAEDGQLLTGVKFRMTGSHLHLEIRKTRFNFTTGTLKVGKTNWRYNRNSQKDRKQVNLDNKDIPIRSPDPSLPVSKSGMYLEFTHSDLDMDVAQTTVPFIDAQAVALDQPVPLYGAGVMYKASKNFGGFINLKIMTYNLAKMLSNAYDDTN